MRGWRSRRPWWSFPAAGWIRPTRRLTTPGGRAGCGRPRRRPGSCCDRTTCWPGPHWTTPAFEPRRYETRFYVAALPAGQQAADVSGETDRAQWTAPAVALAAAAEGALALMPPTESILMELAELGSIAAVSAAAVDRVIVSILPEPVRDADGWRFRYPTADDRP